MRRDWRTIAGFLSPLAILTAIVFFFRPTFLSEYMATLGANNLIQRTTVPTLTGFLAQLFDVPALRLGGLLLLPIAVWLWWQKQRREPIDITELVIWTLLASIVTVPFGWSFDTIVLLLPLLVLPVWALEKRLPTPAAISAFIIYVAANGLFFYQRTQQRIEADYFWFPSVMAVLYIGGWWLARRRMRAGE